MSDENATPDGAQQGAAAPSGQAGDNKKRRPRTPEEILKDIAADEQEAIRKVQERAAKARAEVEKKLGAAAKKAAAVEMVDGFRSGIKDALKKPDMQDAEADEVLKKIVQEGLAKLTAETAAAPAANAAPLTLAA